MQTRCARTEEPSLAENVGEYHSHHLKRRNCSVLYKECKNLNCRTVTSNKNLVKHQIYEQIAAQLLITVLYVRLRYGIGKEPFRWAQESVRRWKTGFLTVCRSAKKLTCIKFTGEMHHSKISHKTHNYPQSLYVHSDGSFTRPLAPLLVATATKSRSQQLKNVCFC